MSARVLVKSVETNAYLQVVTCAVTVEKYENSEDYRFFLDYTEARKPKAAELESFVVASKIRALADFQGTKPVLTASAVEVPVLTAPAVKVPGLTASAVEVPVAKPVPPPPPVPVVEAPAPAPGVEAPAPTPVVAPVAEAPAPEAPVDLTQSDNVVLYCKQDRGHASWMMGVLNTVFKTAGVENWTKNPKSVLTAKMLVTTIDGKIPYLIDGEPNQDLIRKVNDYILNDKPLL